MEPALSGILVLDLSTDIAGSFACMLLADMGADVIKVELADRPNWRGQIPYHLWNRSKKSLCIDLNKDEGWGVLGTLVNTADVVVESFLPLEAQTLALDYRTLSNLNHRLIYCAIPPFGEDGPLKDKPGEDGAVGAYAGVYGDQTGEELPPAFVTVPAPSYGSAFLAAYAVSSALYVREISGIGQKIDVPLLNGALAMQSGNWVEGKGVTRVERTRKDPRGESPAYRLYECADSQWIFIACGNVMFWNRFCITLGLEGLATDPRSEGAPWSFPDDFRSYLIKTFGEILITKTSQEWQDIFWKADVPTARAATRDEFMDDPQVAHNNMIINVDDTILGPTRQMGIPVWLSNAPGKVTGPAPSRGQNSEEILKELGYAHARVMELLENGVVIG